MIEFKDSRVTAMIEKCGSHIVGIAGEGGPSFAYTIGFLPKLGHELLIVGMRPEYAAAIFNHIHEQMLANPGFKLDLDKPDDRWCNGSVVWKQCTNPIIHDEYTVQADSYWGKEVPAVQMIMPDRAGKFPWEDGFDLAYMESRQPLLCQVN